MTDTEKRIIGENIANAFCMQRTKKGLYKTSWGNKTEIGIYEMFLILFNNFLKGEVTK